MTPPPSPRWFGQGTLSRFLLLHVTLAGLLALVPSLVLFALYPSNKFRDLFLIFGLAMMGLAMAITALLHWLVYRRALPQQRHAHALLLSCGAAMVLNLFYVIL